MLYCLKSDFLLKQCIVSCVGFFLKSIKNLNPTQITYDRARKKPFICVGSGNWRPYCHTDSAFFLGQSSKIHRELKLCPNRKQQKWECRQKA